MSDQWQVEKWRSPSNIALIKYWGKHGDQLPMNASVSMTLKNSYTETEVHYRPKQGTQSDVSFVDMEADHEKRILAFIEKRKDLLAHLNAFDLKIKTHNSFPHQAGIASSASGLSALSLCLLAIAGNEKDFIQRVSELSRLGSGSASRSVIAEFAVWGTHQSSDQYNNNFALPFARQVDPVFKQMQNSILIVDNGKKPVSSSRGHAMMENNVYRDARLKSVNQKFTDLHLAMEEGDWDNFAEIVIAEAWELHALMLLSKPAYTLLRPGTLTLIEKINKFRDETKTKCCWTLDAGPNIHFLYAKSEKDKVRKFIADELSSHVMQVLHDEMGQGPERLNHE